jgi:hypothetical protein
MAPSWGERAGAASRALPSKLRPRESGRRDNRIFPEGVQRRQIGVAGDDGVRPAIHRQLKALVVVRVAATRHRLGDRHRLGNGKHPAQAIEEGRRDLGSDAPPLLTMMLSWVRR